MYLILLIFIETGIQLSIIADSVKLDEVSPDQSCHLHLLQCTDIALRPAEIAESRQSNSGYICTDGCKCVCQFIIVQAVKPVCSRSDLQILLII